MKLTVVSARKPTAARFTFALSAVLLRTMALDQRLKCSAVRAILKVCVHRKKIPKKNLQVEKERPVEDIEQISIRPTQIAASVRTFKADEAWPKTTTQSCRQLLIIKLGRRM